jgi:hypothetical protein
MRNAVTHSTLYIRSMILFDELPREPVLLDVSDKVRRLKGKLLLIDASIPREEFQISITEENPGTIHQGKCTVCVWKLTPAPQGGIQPVPGLAQISRFLRQADVEAIQDSDLMPDLLKQIIEG